MSNNQRWEGLTISDVLPIGVYYAGKRHREFTLRVALADDVITAQEAYPDGTMMLVGMEMLRLQLLRLGDIPMDMLTLEVLREGLISIDQEVLLKADGELTKKLKPASGASETGVSPSMSSSGTDTALTNSA